MHALDSVSLAVGRGEVVGILGPNGSGKSTLVRVVSTLVVPDAGSVEVFGVDAVRHPKKVQRSMNRVSVEASFFKKMSAMENLLYGAKLYGVTTGEARLRIKEIFENIGFAHKRALEPMEHLSRGMQQKVALARASDEPHPDAPRRADDGPRPQEQEGRAGLHKAHQGGARLFDPALYTMDEAEELCDRVGIMVDRVLALDKPEDLKRRYASNGRVPTLEETFMAATGYSVEEASAEGED